VVPAAVFLVFMVMSMVVVMSVLVAMLVRMVVAVLVCMTMVVGAGGICGRRRFTDRSLRREGLERLVEFIIGRLHVGDSFANHFGGLGHAEIFQDASNFFITFYVVRVMVFPVRQTDPAFFRFIHGGPLKLVRFGRKAETFVRWGYYRNAGEESLEPA
jgi:hypothetical protein